MIIKVNKSVLQKVRLKGIGNELKEQTMLCCIAAAWAKTLGVCLFHDVVCSVNLEC